MKRERETGRKKKKEEREKGKMKICVRTFCFLRPHVRKVETQMIEYSLLSVSESAFIRTGCHSPF